MFIESAPSEEEHNIQEEIKTMSGVGFHENVVGLLRTCLSERESPLHVLVQHKSFVMLLQPQFT